MGSIKYGELDISKIYWGDAEVSKVYYGDTLIYEVGGTPTPSYYLYWTNASVYVDEENSYTYNGITLSLSSSTRVDYKSTGIVYQSSDLSLNGSTSALNISVGASLYVNDDEGETKQDALNDAYTYSFTITADTSYTIATTYHSLSNLKNRTFLLDKITWSNYSYWLMFIIEHTSLQYSDTEPYTISSGFTSNGTHFKGFNRTSTTSGKNTTYNLCYVADDNSNVIVATIESMTLTWTNSAYQTIKFDNLDLYDRVLEQWLLQFATEQ